MMIYIFYAGINALFKLSITIQILTKYLIKCIITKHSSPCVLITYNEDIHRDKIPMK